jgi:excisionase family DNA binding protein
MDTNHDQLERGEPGRATDAGSADGEGMTHLLLYGGDDELPAFLTPDEAATRMRVSRWTVYDSIKAGTMPATRVGRTIRIPRAAVIATSGPPDGD